LKAEPFRGESCVRAAMGGPACQTCRESRSTTPCAGTRR
jgi:hypothetical protein